MRNRKLRNTRSDRRSRDPLEVSLWCSLRRPRLIFSMVTGTKHPRLIFSMVTWTKHPRPIFSMVTGTSLGYLPLLFSYSVYIGCVVLLRVHLKISTCKMFFFNIFKLLMFKIRQQLTKIKSINRFVITCGYFFWFIFGFVSFYQLYQIWNTCIVTWIY